MTKHWLELLYHGLQPGEMIPLTLIARAAKLPQPSMWVIEQACRALRVTIVPWVPPPPLKDDLGFIEQRWKHGRWGYCLAVKPGHWALRRTILHELAHVALGHVGKGKPTRSFVAKGRQEWQAEAVAVLCYATMGCGQRYAGFSRRYMRSWWVEGDRQRVRQPARVWRAAERILRAGSVTDV